MGLCEITKDKGVTQAGPGGVNVFMAAGKFVLAGEPAHSSFFASVVGPLIRNDS